MGVRGEELEVHVESVETGAASTVRVSLSYEGDSELELVPMRARLHDIEGATIAPPHSRDHSEMEGVVQAAEAGAALGRSVGPVSNDGAVVGAVAATLLVLPFALIARAASARARPRLGREPTVVALQFPVRLDDRPRVLDLSSVIVGPLSDVDRARISNIPLMVEGDVHAGYEPREESVDTVFALALGGGVWIDPAMGAVTGYPSAPKLRFGVSFEDTVELSFLGTGLDPAVGAEIRVRGALSDTLRLSPFARYAHLLRLDTESAFHAITGGVALEFLVAQTEHYAWLEPLLWLGLSLDGGAAIGAQRADPLGRIGLALEVSARF
jgi:hypothetical protein